MSNTTLENKIKLSEYYVAYFDILGSKKMIESSEAETFLNVINHIYKNTIFTINSFYKKNHNIEIKVKIFSDNIIFAIEKDKEDTEVIKADKKILITAIASFFQVLALKYTMPVRGSITIGDLYIDEIFVYGKALNNAYKLESKIAIYPRVIIDPNIKNEFLQNNYIRENLCCDEEGIYYLNSFKEYYNIRQIYASDEIKKIYEVLKARLFICDSEEIRQKNYWLINLFNNFCLENNYNQYVFDTKSLPQLTESLIKEYFENAK
ncbi:hypothetical protein IJ425_06750 [bacterium]|nr:hypothetical protein [bacterium]